MAPISEKRASHQYKKNTVKENVTTNTSGSSAAAAAAAADPLNRKTLEILDFRDTWIQQLRNDPQVRIPPRLLGPHNHGRAVQGCQRCDAPTHTAQDKRNDEMEVAKKASGKQNKKHHHNSHHHHPQQQQNQQLQQQVQGLSSSRSKSKGREVNKIWIGDSQTFEYILKSARGEIKPNKSGNLRASHKSGTKRNNKICECGSRSSNDDDNNYNIIVNPFYAEQLMHGDKTDKTFSNLKKHFPPTDYPDPHVPYRSKNNNTNTGDTTSNDKHAKRDKDAENLSSPAGSEDGDPQPEDSEEEYFGYPFYLSHDASTGHQSKYIKKDGFHYTPKSIISPSIFPKVAPYLAFSSYFEKGPSAPALLRRILKWRLSPATPRVVKKIVLNSGFRLIKNTSDWMAVWDRHIKSPSFKTIRLHQKYNHIPGSFRLGRKDTIWRSLRSNIAKFGKHEFGIMQTTYIMPEDRKNFRRMWQNYSKKSTKWIVKPPASARGCGISVVHKWQQIPKDEPVVVQKYIQRPLLINENKFDLRLYVLVTSVNPLRIFMYKDGLARFASVKYNADSKTLNEKCMHLTNYSINKFSQNYAKNEDVNACQGHKWSLQSLFSFLEERDVNTILLWAGLRNLVIKSIISGESALNRLYRQNVNSRYNCFELLGFDVLLDEDVIPWLLEVNVSPSLHSELPLDWHVKGPLIQAVLNTALYQIPPKLSEKHQEELLDDLDLEGPLCFDHRLFTTCLTAEEIRKHNQFTKPSMELREEYLEAILEDLKPDDVRCLVILEDELQRSKPLERIFPTSKSHIYLKYVENPRYYNRLVDAWETKYADNRSEGIALLTGYCKRGVHLNVSIDASLKEPDVALTDIDLMYKKKIPMDDDNISIDQSDFDPPAGVTALKPVYLPIPSPTNVVRGCSHAIGAVYSKENNDNRARLSKVPQNNHRRRPISVPIN